MAYSASIIKRTVVGDVRLVILSCVADAASGDVSGGVGVCYDALISPVSMATQTNGVPRVKINVLQAGTAANGSIGFSGCTSGDVFYIHVYGR